MNDSNPDLGGADSPVGRKSNACVFGSDPIAEVLRVLEYDHIALLPTAVALHSNVGLMHASMAIFNAWCDRMPNLMLGAIGFGPVGSEADLADALEKAVEAVKAGAVCVIDVRVAPEYARATSSAVTREMATSK
jgi:hypothetical protein